VRIYPATSPSGAGQGLDALLGQDALELRLVSGREQLADAARATERSEDDIQLAQDSHGAARFPQEPERSADALSVEIGANQFQRLIEPARRHAHLVDRIDIAGLEDRIDAAGEPLLLLVHERLQSIA
jgi:hypothetical protein